MDEKEVEDKLKALDKAVTKLKKSAEHFSDSISSTLVSITDASRRIYKLEMEVIKLNQKLK